MFQASGLGTRSCGSGAGMIGVILEKPWFASWKLRLYIGFPKIWSAFLGGPQNKDYSIFLGFLFWEGMGF